MFGMVMEKCAKENRVQLAEAMSYDLVSRKADIIGWERWIIMDLIKCYNHLNVELIFIIIKMTTYAISWAII